MITAVAPGRVNLIGDHTDYTGGLVLPFAIDLATVIEGVRGGSTINLRSRELDGSVNVSLLARHDENITPPWGRYVSAVASLIQPSEGFVGSIRSDIPLGGGLSSSAALEVAVALALGADLDPLRLAELCRNAEHLATGVPTGIMDQLCIASAREGHATLIDCHTKSITHVPISDEVDVVVRFVAQRTLEGSEYSERVAECTRAESEIGPLRQATEDDVARLSDEIVRSRARHVVTENARVTSFAAALQRGDWTSAGASMTSSHRSLTDDYGVSTPQMDEAVQETLAIPGVFGSRMTGGGFGGCIVTLCRPDADVPGWRVKPSAGARVSHDATK
ncbi:MAG: galactokinase [Actinomycetota bacterium]